MRKEKNRRDFHKNLKKRRENISSHIKFLKRKGKSVFFLFMILVRKM